MTAGHMGQPSGHSIRLAAAFLPLALLFCAAPAWAKEVPAASPAPAGSGEVTAPRSARPRLFGTVEFRRPLEKQKNWLAVLKRNADSPIFDDERKLRRSTTWKQLREKAQSGTRLHMLAEVNRFWNAWPYRADREVWGKEDFWAAPAEFLSRSGDCEDYCIAKYFTLRELGIPAEEMRIVIVRETIRGLAHAVLAVYDGQDVHILDNLSDQVRPMRRVRNYQPHFSVNEKGRWMHVKATPVKKNGKPMENGHDTKR